MMTENESSCITVSGRSCDTILLEFAAPLLGGSSFWLYSRGFNTGGDGGATFSELLLCVDSCSSSWKLGQYISEKQNTMKLTKHTMRMKPAKNRHMMGMSSLGTELVYSGGWYSNGEWLQAGLRHSAVSRMSWCSIAMT